MIATDPLSLGFIFCILVAGLFLILTSVLGVGHLHVLHLAHAAQSGHAIHAVHHAGTSAHSTGHSTAHSTGHSSAHTTTNTDEVSIISAPHGTPWQSLSATALGALNLYSLLMLLLVFGLLGYILHNSAHAGTLIAILVPLLCGLAVAVAVGAFLQRFFDTADAGELTLANSRIDGQIGTVTVAVRAGGTGEVVFSRPGQGRQSISAVSADGEAIPAGTEIVILSYASGIASVQTWERFMATARTPQASSLPPGEQLD